MKQKGFTLIELLVVISIIGLLASVVLVSLNSARTKARDTRRKADLKQIATALELYYNDNSSYPSTGGGWWSACGASAGWTGTNKGTSGANGWIPNLAPTYLSALPLDPRRGSSTANLTGLTGLTDAQQFCYIYNSNGVDYKVAAHCAVENGPITSTMAFYTGHDGWECPDYNFAVYTSGAQLW